MNGRFTTSNLELTYGQYAMKRAFVLQLGYETDISQRKFVGRIEEVDSGRELRFRSTEELLEFLAQCFDDARRAELEVDEDKPEWR